ncbi:putative Histone-lysine N-methyltransferase, H3 lysine-79 specific [Glarea lozoyensis 74030]|uniref:Histone-lysine N-methyltransferase, H3 lysine-79 specific n=1 Tax=Glarea lozoyensis (strain ATCC 74030 / MF5533) TaxID=1104152 RepID=H0EXV5_GLAL7|nr:putative Histone-lysine N-methyltransferase, H3 lysine-79 specific [Glarea lozoyensis 74030]
MNLFGGKTGIKRRPANVRVVSAPVVTKAPAPLPRNLVSSREQERHNRGKFAMIHAADTTAVPRKTSTISESATIDDITVKLRYPSASQRERYDLEFGKDRIDSVQEIIDIAKTVADFYLTDEQAKPFLEPNSGYIRQLEKARNNLANNKKRGEITPRPVLLNDFKAAVDQYNAALQKLRLDKVLEQNLDDKHHLPFNMVKLILNQVYERAVSPKVDLLRQYENGGDNVYGELLPKLVNQVLTETNLKSDQVFVDLGSGVGNVALQAALEFGCESWGCEMMENACTLADAQKREFSARCRLWGIATGKVHLEKGDFLENQRIHATMKRADVILVNNQAFTSQLNQALVNLFLDLKDGCKIISLKPFVPAYHVITDRNDNDPVNNLRVTKEGEYYSDSVSWTGERGIYFITEKDATRRHLARE